MSIQTVNSSTIKVLALMEATTVTGPAKNLIQFAQRARDPDTNLPGLPRVVISVVTFHRSRAASTTRESLRSDEAQPLVVDEAPNSFVAAAREAGIEVDVIRERFLFDPQVIGALRGVVGRRAPDVIQTHNVKSHFLLKLSGLWRQCPWVAFQHGYTATDLKMLAYNQLDRWSLSSPDRVVTVCGAFALALARTGVPPGRISVLHNSVNTNRTAGAAEVAALRSQLGVMDQGTRLLLAVGRFSREKGHVDLISALSHLRRINPDLDFRLILVGDGPERQQIERAAASLGLTERIIFAGHVSNVRPYYALADVLVLPSHSEGSPNVLLEAMAANLPVVAAAVGGVPEIASDGESALLVAPRDPEAMAAAVSRLLTDTQLACNLASNAFASVSASYSPDSYLRSLVEIYRGLVPGAVAEDARALRPRLAASK